MVNIVDKNGLILEYHFLWQEPLLINEYGVKGKVIFGILDDICAFKVMAAVGQRLDPVRRLWIMVYIHISIAETIV